MMSQEIANGLSYLLDYHRKQAILRKEPIYNHAVPISLI